MIVLVIKLSDISNLFVIQYGLTSDTVNVLFPVAYKSACGISGILQCNNSSSYDSSQIKSIELTQFIRTGKKYPLYWISVGC